MKIRAVRKLIPICALAISAAIVVYLLSGVHKTDKVGKGVSPEEIDDERIIVAKPDAGEEKTIVDRVLEKFGVETIQDNEIPLASSSFYAKDVGMVPNDKSQALFNANQLIKILNSNNKVIIDDKYYITTPSELLTTGTIEITGVDNAELIIDNKYNSKLFDTAAVKNITLKNLAFVNENGKNAFLIIYNDKTIGRKVDRIDVQDCSFNGNISLYRYYGDTNLDSDTVDFGIDEFVFNNNTVSNTKFSFVVLVDIPVKHCELVGNRIQNFTYTFLNISINNEAANSTKLYNHISYLKVDSNIVTCDDSWWGDTSSGAYYTFVLFEGNEVLYNNNHVEGMKALNDFAVYDAYLSANTVTYTNNMWKNNICFNQNKRNNTLLKSKGGGSDSLTRDYMGNKFIVEEDFAERVGQSKDNMYVDFISLTQHADKYNINNNTFDVYDLRFPESSMSISDFSFCNNTITAKKASGNLAIVRMDDEFDVNSIEINDNIINIESKSVIPFNIAKVVDARKSSNGNVEKISVKNNKISAPLGYIFYDVLADNLDFTNNTIIDTGSEYPGLAYRGSFIQSNIADNTIESKNSVTFYEGRQLYGAGYKIEVLELERNNYVSGNNGLHLDIEYNSEVPTTYKRKYTFNTQNETYEFYYTFTLSYNSEAKCAEVTFSNNDGKTNTYKLGTDDKSINGSGQYIKLVSTNAAEEIPFRIRFSNSANSAVFYIVEYNSDFSSTRIETESFLQSDSQSIG